MESLRRVSEPAARVVTAARRPGTYVGQAREVAAVALTAGLWPFGLAERGLGVLSDPDVPSREPTPVLLVHGYGANRSNWLYLARGLREAGFERLHALNYNPTTADLPRLAEACAERAEELRAHFGVDRIHIVGHSLGGLIARYAVQVLGLQGVDTCLTVASPHGGLRLARYGSVASELSPLASGLQLRPDSPTMVLLRSCARSLPTRFVAYYSNLDLVVPASRAMIREPELEARNVLVKDQGHFSILLCRQLTASVVEELASAEPTSEAAEQPRVATAA